VKASNTDAVVMDMACVMTHMMTFGDILTRNTKYIVLILLMWPHFRFH